MQPNPQLAGQFGQVGDEGSVDGLRMLACGIHVEGTHMPQLGQHHQVGAVGSLAYQAHGAGNPRMHGLLRGAVQLDEGDINGHSGDPSDLPSRPRSRVS